MITMKDRIKEYKVKFYLTAAAQRRFNITKTCKEMGISKADFYNHLPRNKKDIIALAKEKGLFEL